MKNELGTTGNTLVDWSSFCRDLCIDWFNRTKEKIGGAGLAVEIGESKLGERKDDRDRGSVIHLGKWVFGGYDRSTKKLFVVIVEERTRETLIGVLRDWIRPGTTIVSNCLKKYNCLEDDEFMTFSSNNAIEFELPANSLQTKNIDRAWRSIR